MGENSPSLLRYHDTHLRCLKPKNVFPTYSAEYRARTLRAYFFLLDLRYNLCIINKFKAKPYESKTLCPVNIAILSIDPA